jgi:hypothetical protein
MLLQEISGGGCAQAADFTRNYQLNVPAGVEELLFKVCRRVRRLVLEDLVVQKWFMHFVRPFLHGTLTIAAILLLSFLFSSSVLDPRNVS